ncbi:U-box domain-containing protein 4 isoform X2 [Canna indica]|uniref:U-box domain-containing protein 4 isoform X2 n=1 Tax=Canna indica TaxID=4628 RepID=A0AAQ3K1E4_9LILI|nr:U-box domain-containing protein 4 isoform X2 [Canna indica]
MVADYCAKRIHEVVAEEWDRIQNPECWKRRWEVAFHQGFARVDDEIIAEAVAPDIVGSTAIVVVLSGCHIISSNCGDSRAVLCRGSQRIQLTADHKPDREDELTRIESLGGRVINWQGPRISGVLAVSRSIGDRYMRPWVIPVPEVTFMPRSENDECLILASDGLWDVMSIEEVGDITCRLLRWHRRNGLVDGAPPPAQAVANHLTELAYQKNSSDNISVVYVPLQLRLLGQFFIEPYSSSVIVPSNQTLHKNLNVALQHMLQPIWVLQGQSTATLLRAPPSASASAAIRDRGRTVIWQRFCRSISVFLFQGPHGMDSANGIMEMKELLDSTTKFHFLSSSNNVKADLVQRYYQTIDRILERFKPVCDEIAASEVSLGEQLVNMLEELDGAVNEAKELLVSWHPMMSKIHFVLQIEKVVLKICTSTLEINKLVTSVLPCAASAIIEECSEYMDEERISNIIDKAIRDHAQKDRPRPEHLDMISKTLSLSSNQELLMEVVALEKLGAKVGCKEMQAETENTDHIISLVTYMHNYLVKDKQLHSINGVAIPADFCCPLSLELMSDPVIVASGQTYERAFIRKWLDQGFNVCPRTRQTLGHTNLIPNYTVKALIANWCESNNIKLPDPIKSMGWNLPSLVKSIDTSASSWVSHSGNSANVHHLRSPEHEKVITSPRDSNSSNGVPQETYRIDKPESPLHRSLSGSSLLQIANGSKEDVSALSLVCMEGNKESGLEQKNISSSSQTANQSKIDSEPSTVSEQFACHKTHNRTESASSALSRHNHFKGTGSTNALSRVSSDLTQYSSDTSVEVTQDGMASSNSRREPEFASPLGEIRNENIWRRAPVPRFISSQSADSRPDLSGVESQVRKLIEDLRSDSVDIQRKATEELRLLAKHNTENRVVIANCGAISLLVGLLHSTDPRTQENAVTTLLNLSINDNNKIAIANADAIDPLIYVLETGNPEAKENSAATLFSLSVIEENKVRIGRSGAIKPLVELLANGTPRGKKDAATALFNLSIYHENKLRVVQAGAVKHLVELMDPAAGMVDKAVAVLANLATITEGRNAIGQANGIPVLVEVVELGSARGKENAASALLQLCTNNGRFCSLVLQEGAVPPLVALSQSGTPRAKEKAQALLSYFRNQRHGSAGRG